MGADEATPVTDDYKERDNKFTGKIGKVTIEYKETKAAEHEQADHARKVATAKKALAD